MLVIFKMLANANRVSILLAMRNSNAALSVNDICTITKLPQPKVSDHLRLLKIYKIVEAKQESTNMLYKIKDEVVANLIQNFQ